jgi:hypothetical protein
MDCFRGVMGSYPELAVQGRPSMSHACGHGPNLVLKQLKAIHRTEYVLYTRCENPRRYNQDACMTQDMAGYVFLLCLTLSVIAYWASCDTGRC